MAHPETTSALRVAAGLSILAGFLACGGDAETTQQAAASEQREEGDTEAELSDRSAPNTPPHIEWVRFEPEAPTVGANVRALVEVTDAEGDAIFLRYAWKVADESTQDESSKIRLLGVSKGDGIEVVVVASDGKDESESVSALTEVFNSPPRLLRVSLSPAKELWSGMDLIATPEGRDPDAEQVTFQFEWSVNGRRVREQSPVLKTANLRRGDAVRVSVVATDGESMSEPFVTPPIRVVNAPPRIVSRPGEMSGNGVFRYKVVAEDPDGDVQLQFRLKDAPAGMSIHPIRGDVTWSPAPEQVGTYAFSVIVDDLQGGRSSQTVEVTVSAPAGSLPAKVR